MSISYPPPAVQNSLSPAPAESARDVQHVANLPRCACGGIPRHFVCPQGHYFLCRERCNHPGSGVYPTREAAERAWITVQATQAQD